MEEGTQRGEPEVRQELKSNFRDGLRTQIPKGAEGLHLGRSEPGPVRAPSWFRLRVTTLSLDCAHGWQPERAVGVRSGSLPPESS